MCGMLEMRRCFEIFLLGKEKKMSWGSKAGLLGSDTSPPEFVVNLK